MKLASAWLAGLAVMSVSSLAAAQEMGNVKAGQTYAEYICAECHAVGSGQRRSPHERAPSFQIVAETRGMTSTALRGWFQTPHPSMTNLQLTEQQSDDLVAYILSLKKR